MPNPASAPSEMIRSGMVQFHPALKPFLVNIDQIECHPENYNNGDVDAIVASIETNGMYNVVKVQASTGYIVAGNHTWMACKELGATVIPAVYLDITDESARRMLIGDNWIAGLAKPDNGQMLALIKRIEQESGLYGTGVMEHDVATLEALTKIDNQQDEFGQWPTICVQVPPATKKAYYEMTEAAVGDRERLELLMRLAGWHA
jgi:hypothetical protein